MVRTGRGGGGQSCSCRRAVFIPRFKGKGVCRCFAGEKANEKERRRRRRRREKEGGTLTDAGRQEGGRHAPTHTRTVRVMMRKAKQQQQQQKMSLSVNKYSDLNMHAGRCQQGDIISFHSSHTTQ